jgi:uncharacterized RDD family membrane protein YckC
MFSRVGAAALDWAVCLAIFYALLLAVALLLALFDADDDSALATALLFLPGAASTLAYFTWGRARGSTLGMTAARLRVVGAGGGTPPSGRQAFARSILSLLVGASVFALAVVAFSDRPEGGYSNATQVVVAVALAVACVGVLGILWVLVDPKRQTAQDKLVGLVVEQREPAPPDRAASSSTA